MVGDRTPFVPDGAMPAPESDTGTGTREKGELLDFDFRALFFEFFLDRFGFGLCRASFTIPSLLTRSRAT